MRDDAKPARKRSTGVRSRTASQRRRFLEASDRVCGFCGGPGADTVDDIRPLALGGVDEPSNWRPAHARCNKSAGAKLGNALRGQRRKAAQADFSEVAGDSALKTPLPPRIQTGKAPGRKPIETNVVPLQRTRPKRSKAPRRADLVTPRLETSRGRGRSSLGPEAVAWINGSGILGRMQLLPWQEYVLDRMLEVTPGRSPRLRWRTVIVTVSRQQGKSVLLRSLAWWRMHQAHRFGEEQLVLHTANLAMTAREVWRPAAQHAMAVYGKKAAKFGKGMEEIDLEGVGGRWLVQAASENTGVGFSISTGIVDEAWNVPTSTVADALVPAMSQREQPQLLLVSTAGDSSSTLLRRYREQALQDTAGDGDVLLVEWSAPPEAKYDDPQTWAWASPYWTERRQEFLASQLASVSEASFRAQYLNQWVASVDGWIPATAWSNAASDLSPDGRPSTTAVEVSLDGSRFAVVSAWEVGTSIVLRAATTRSSSVLWDAVNRVDAPRLLLPPSLAVHYAGRRKPIVVGATEMGRYMLGVGRAILEGRVLHDPADHVLTDDVLRAVAVTTEAGMRLSIRKSPGPIEAARAMVWAVGEILRPAAPKPRIRAG